MYMNYITTTELRTKSTELVNALLLGNSVTLIHRSKVIGKIQPEKNETKVFNAKRFLKIVKKLNLPKLTPKEMERNYQEHMQKKYGKGLS